MSGNRASRPRLVLITGEPGSGKSVLGTELGRALRVPFIARDDVRGGLFFTEGAWSETPRRVPPPAEAVEALLQVVETMAGLGVSCVVEYVIRQARQHDLERLQAVADCVVLFLSCGEARNRLVRRSQSDRLLNRPALLDALGFASIDDHIEAAVWHADRVIDEMRTEFDLPTMRVATDHGYEPDLDQIIDFVIQRAVR